MRTFENNGRVQGISLAHLTDEEIASSLIVLTHDAEKVSHQGIICYAARDRIKCLMYEKAQLLELVRHINEDARIRQLIGEEWFERRGEILKDMEE